MNNSFHILLASIFSVLVAGTFQAHANENQLSAEEQAQGWELLFNGSDLSHWRNFKQKDLNEKWVVVDGTMKLSGKGGGDIMTRKSYRNFDLRLEWNISEGGNSGIFILVDEAGDKIYSRAPEIQILDNERHLDRMIDSHRSGSLYDMVPSHPSSHRPAGQWNQVRIKFVDGFLEVWQNEVKTVNITLGDSAWETLLDASKFGGGVMGLFSDFEGFGEGREGHIGLQDHSDPVSFRNLKILPLD
ncbi:3-keto-disaccharide hydrolase [Halioglobus maricola]|uniref:3-keto-disaccharide hydrolase n=1 Tax=Halioglobus maricola TaxID=2601894 RepID=UPI001F107B7C|nr:DUF1080 domain-containing protein [Halioglobus maricola]